MAVANTTAQGGLAPPGTVNRHGATRVPWHIETKDDCMGRPPGARASSRTRRPPRARPAAGRTGTTLAALFTAAVERNPDAIAVVSGGTRLTYRELDER